MGIYSKAAIAAYTMIVEKSLTPRDAWNAAIASITTSPSAKRKVCPRATFLALADNGYLKGVDSSSSVERGGILSERAIAAADLVLSHPAATPRYLADNLDGYVDKQGSYDIVIELAKNGLLRRARQ